MAPRYGAGSCCGFGWWGGSIKLAFGTQTYALQLTYPGSTSSTGGCRIAIVSPNDNAVSSTQGTLLPPNWVEVVRCSPGQRVSAISNDAGTFSLSITELTD
jgi:hypothetical protein